MAKVITSLLANKTVVFPLASYPSGTQTFPAQAIGDTVEAIGMEVQRCTTADPTIWPNASTTLSGVFELSFDGGQSWIQSGRFDNVAGGIATNKNGEVPLFHYTCGTTPGTNRQVRGTITIVNGPLRSTGSFTFE